MYVRLVAADSLKPTIALIGYVWVKALSNYWEWQEKGPQFLSNHDIVLPHLMLLGLGFNYSIESVRFTVASKLIIFCRHTKTD